MGIVKKTFLLIAFFSIIAFSANAKALCYSSKEEVAEKILRLHSELMVITVTCRQGSDGRDLGRAYTRLTRKYIKPIKKSEKILQKFYAKHYGGNGIDKLDKLRTKLANEYSQIVARESASSFCKRRRNRVTRLYDSRSLSFKRESLRSNRYIELNLPTCRYNDKMAENR